MPRAKGLPPEPRRSASWNRDAQTAYLGSGHSTRYFPTYWTSNSSYRRVQMVSPLMTRRRHCPSREPSLQRLPGRGVAGEFFW